MVNKKEKSRADSFFQIPADAPECKSIGQQVPDGGLHIAICQETVQLKFLKHRFIRDSQGIGKTAPSPYHDSERTAIP